MKCPNCNKEIADNAKFCPECGHNFSQPKNETTEQPQPQVVYVQQPQPEPKKKKPLWLKIVIGIVGLFILFAILGSCSDSSDSSSSQSSSSSSSASSAPASSSSTGTEQTTTGSSSSSESSSTPIGVYTKLSQISTIDFTISDKAKAFIIGHPDLFPAKANIDCDKYANYGIEYKHLSKNAENYGDSMVVLNGTIEQIKEIKPEDSGLKDVVTSMRISDYDYNNYMVFYIGSIDLYEGDAVTVFGVPLSMGSYTNTMNGTTSCAVLAAGYAEKQISG